MSAVLIASALLSGVSGQSYSSWTFAGGGLSIHVPGTSASLPVANIAVDGAGNLYFGNQNAVVCLNATTGILTAVAGNGTPGFSGDDGPAVNAQVNYPAGIVVDANGSLYIADSWNHRVRKVSNGIITTVAGGGSSGLGDNGPATSAELSFPSGLALDSANQLYIADSGNNRVRKVSNQIITTVAGNGTAGFSGDNGPATSAQLSYLSSLAVDSAGDLYITDNANGRVRKVSNGVITTVAGNGALPMGNDGDGGPATSAQLNSPSGIVVDAAGNLYVADAGNSRIRKVSKGIISTVAGVGTAGFSGDNGPATSAQLYDPQGIALDSEGSLYIADPGNNRIRKISNGVINTLAGNGTVSFSGDNGPAASAQLWGPQGVAVDSASDLYIADTKNNRVRKVSNGVITTVAGNGTSGFSGDNGEPLGAQLAGPNGVAVDSLGDLYIDDYENNRIRRVRSGVITTVAGNGAPGFSGDEGPAASAQLNRPAGIACDADGNLYIADSNNSRVRMVSNGVITTVAGNGTFGFSGDNGPATSAQLFVPGGIALDPAGNLYIADTRNNRIRKVSKGVITTVAGNGSKGYSGDNGPAVNAQLNQPLELAVDSGGNLYIADSGNNRLRMVSSGVITTLAGNFSSDSGASPEGQSPAPYGVAVDSAGNVFVADTLNDRVRLLTPNASSCGYSVSPTTIGAPAAGGNLSFSIQTSSSCLWTVANLPTWMTTSASSGTGPATITLAVAANRGVPLGATVSIAGVAVTVTQPAPAPAIDPGGIENAASAAGGPLAPGSIATVYGNLPLTSAVWAAESPLPTALGGLSIQFSNGVLAPLFFADQGQVNFQIPWELAGPSSLAPVQYGVAGVGQALNLAAFSPGIFTTNAQGFGQGAVLDPSYALVDASNPAIAGVTVVQIFCTGLGAVTNQPRSGSPASRETLSMTISTPSVRIGGADATVLFSGLAPGFVGGYQVNALVPADSVKGAAVPVVITIGGITSNVVTIGVQ